MASSSASPGAVFSRYVLQSGLYRGAKLEDWVVGEAVFLDPWDGFYDQSLDHLDPGAKLTVLLQDGPLYFTYQSLDACRALLDQLHSLTIVEGELLAREGFRIERVSPFNEFAASAQLMDVEGLLAEIRKHIERARLSAEHHAKVAPRDRQYSGRWILEGLSIGIPRLSAIREAARVGLAGHVWDESPRYAIRGFRFTLVELLEAGSFRVYALGSNEVDTCRIEVLEDVGGYEAALKDARAATSSLLEEDFWNVLLS